MVRKILIGIGILLGIGLVGFAFTYYFFLGPMLKQYEVIRNMNIEDINFNELKDGIYIGEYSFGVMKYKVKATVSSGIVNKIEVLENVNNDYSKRAEEVLNRVIENQSMKVDVVSGATTTSKTLLKALENALEEGLQ
jgi:uncharacterized protein with FMN-binding domain